MVEFLAAVAIKLPTPEDLCRTLIYKPLRSLTRLRDGLDLLQHFFHSRANFFPLFSQLHRLTPQRDQLLLALLKLLTRPLRISFRRSLGLPRRFVHLDSAINSLFQRLKIVRRNLIRQLLHRIQRHDCTLPWKDFKLSEVYSTHPVDRTWHIRARVAWLE